MLDTSTAGRNKGAMSRGVNPANATPDFSDEKCQFRVHLSKANKLVHIRTDGLRTAVHGWDAVGLPLQACALPPHGTPLAPCLQGGASTVGTFQIAAKYEYLTRLEGGDTIRCDSLFHTLGLVTSLNGWLNI